MNVTPICECAIGYRQSCKAVANFVVIDKSKGKIYYLCKYHIQNVIEEGNTYSIYPAKDYSEDRNNV